jgi:hypothetical protein
MRGGKMKNNKCKVPHWGDFGYLTYVWESPFLRNKNEETMKLLKDAKQSIKEQKYRKTTNILNKLLKIQIGLK